MAEGEDLGFLNETTNNIAQKLDIEELLEYDNRVRSVIEETFYGTGRRKGLAGIFQYLEKNWKSVQDRSSLTKVLPILITGK